MTGATSGIGREFAQRLGADGLDLIICGRRTEQLEAVARGLRERFGIGVRVVVGDLTDSSVERRLVDAARPSGDAQVEWLVNNAGAGFGAPLSTVDFDNIGRAFSLLVEVPTRLARAVLPAMCARRNGTIVNVGSLAGRVPVPSSSLYVAAKAALERLSESLAIEAGSYGVVVQALLPGFVRTDFHRDDPEIPAAYSGRGLVRWATATSVVDASMRNVVRARRRLTRRFATTAAYGSPRPRDVIVIPGWTNRLLVAVSRVIPRRIVYLAAGRHVSRR